ncbi:unnamed protein product [Sphagnum balticum]
MFPKKKVGPRRKWGRVEDVGWGEDIPQKEGGIGKGWIVAREEVGLRMVFQGGDGAREKVGLGGDDPWEPGRGIWSGGQVGKKLSLGELGEA